MEVNYFYEKSLHKEKYGKSFVCFICIKFTLINIEGEFVT